MSTDSRVTRRGMLALVGGTALAGCAGLRIPGARSPQQADSEAGRTGPRQVARQDGATVRAYVGSYHWGFFILDADGEELDRLTLSTGDELRLTLFSVEAGAAVEELPAVVRSGIPSAEERARRNDQRIPTPQGVDLEDLHEAAEAMYPDHGLAIVRDEFLWPTTPGRGRGSGPGSGRGGPGPGQGGPGPGWDGGWGHHGPGRGPDWGSGWGHHGPGHHGWGFGTGGMLAPPTYLWHHSTVPAELGFVVDAAGSFGFVCTIYCGYGHPYMVEGGRVAVAG